MQPSIALLPDGRRADAPVTHGSGRRAATHRRRHVRFFRGALARRHQQSIFGYLCAKARRRASRAISMGTRRPSTPSGCVNDHLAKRVLLIIDTGAGMRLSAMRTGHGRAGAPIAKATTTKKDLSSISYLSPQFQTRILVRLAGIEPTTPWFVAKYSIQLSYSREATIIASLACFWIKMTLILFCGAGIARAPARAEKARAKTKKGSDIFI